MAYAPFGEGYAGGIPWYQFTASGNASTVYDSEGGGGTLHDFQYRHYSPGQGRWISPDPAGLAAVDPTNPQTWNRYAYVANNPLSFVDPSGLDQKGPGGSGCNSDVYDCSSSGGLPSSPAGASGCDPSDASCGIGFLRPSPSWRGMPAGYPYGIVAWNWNCSAGTVLVPGTCGISQASDQAANNGISGFAGFNMQKAFVANYSNCTGTFHQTPFGKAVQLGSLVALTPLNTDYGANWFETLSMGSLKAAFVGGMKAGSHMVGEAVEGAIGVVATPVLLVATGIDAGASTLCAGNALSASIPVPH